MSSLTLTTDAGVLNIHNIYLPGKMDSDNPETRAGLAALRRGIRAAHGRHVVVGDFNLHYPLWSTIPQSQLLDDDADGLIRDIGDYRLDLLT